MLPGRSLCSHSSNAAECLHHLNYAITRELISHGSCSFHGPPGIGKSTKVLPNLSHSFLSSHHDSVVIYLTTRRCSLRSLISFWRDFRFSQFSNQPSLTVKLAQANARSNVSYNSLRGNVIFSTVAMGASFLYQAWLLGLKPFIIADDVEKDSSLLEVLSYFSYISDRSHGNALFLLCSPLDLSDLADRWQLCHFSADVQLLTHNSINHSGTSCLTYDGNYADARDEAFYLTKKKLLEGYNVLLLVSYTHEFFSLPNYLKRNGCHFLSLALHFNHFSVEEAQNFLYGGSQRVILATITSAQNYNLFSGPAAPSVVITSGYRPLVLHSPYGFSFCFNVLNDSITIKNGVSRIRDRSETIVVRGSQGSNFTYDDLAYRFSDFSALAFMSQDIYQYIPDKDRPPRAARVINAYIRKVADKHNVLKRPMLMKLLSVLDLTELFYVIYVMEFFSSRSLDSSRRLGKDIREEAVLFFENLPSGCQDHWRAMSILRHICTDDDFAQHRAVGALSTDVAAIEHPTFTLGENLSAEEAFALSNPFRCYNLVTEKGKPRCVPIRQMSNYGEIKHKLEVEWIQCEVADPSHNKAALYCCVDGEDELERLPLCIYLPDGAARSQELQTEKNSMRGEIRLEVIIPCARPTKLVRRFGENFLQDLLKVWN